MKTLGTSTDIVHMFTLQLNGGEGKISLALIKIKKL
jgi:hypothetical protein